MSRRAPATVRTEYVVTAFALPSSGPGWANQPIVVVIQEQGGGPIRLEWIQPEEQTDEMRTLYAVSAAVPGTLRKAAARHLRLELMR